MDYGHPRSQVPSLVLPCERVHGVGPEGDLPGGPLDAFGDLRCDGGVEPPPDVEYGDPGVLAHGQTQVLGLLHVLHDGAQLGAGYLPGLPSGAGLQGPPYVLGELGVGQAEEVDDDLVDRFGELYHARAIAHVL